jgi:F0F1-type ATP synthase membrane subunit b/b'
MSPKFLYLCGFLAGASPFLAIAFILLHYFFLRAAWKMKRRHVGERAGFCPSTTALGMVLLFTQVFVRPSVENVIEERQGEDAREDDQGDPEGSKKHLNGQLRRIRCGEPVDDLILRL